jgi:predicted GIY-YIG superfamily endonuclease
MIGVVYKIQNKLNGKIYIGKTTNKSRRLSDHRLAQDEIW